MAPAPQVTNAYGGAVSLAAALDLAAATNMINNGLQVFIRNSNTYVYIESNGANTSADADDLAA